MNRDYTLRTRTVTHAEWLSLAASWAREGGSISPRTTVSETGHLQMHLLDHGSRIHAIYTLSDVLVTESEARP